MVYRKQLKEASKMMKHLLTVGFLSVFLIGLFSGCVGPEVTETFNAEYPVNPQTVIRVSNINGAIEITGWENDLVSVSAMKRSTSGEEGLRSLNISVSQTENSLEIMTKYTGQLLMQSGVDYSIKVPFNTTIDTLTTSNGAVEVSHVRGNLSATSSNGAVTIKNVKGIVTVTTSNGYIEVQNVTGIKSLRTSNAAVDTEIQSIQDNVDIETSNGAVTVYVNPLLNATFEMTTSNADIQLHGITLNTSLLEDTHVIGTLGNDGKKIDIHTSNAHVYLYRLESS